MIMFDEEYIKDLKEAIDSLVRDRNRLLSENEAMQKVVQAGSVLRNSIVAEGTRVGTAIDEFDKVLSALGDSP